MEELEATLAEFGIEGGAGGGDPKGSTAVRTATTLRRCSCDWLIRDGQMTRHWAAVRRMPCQIFHIRLLQMRSSCEVLAASCLEIVFNVAINDHTFCLSAGDKRSEGREEGAAERGRCSGSSSCR